MWLNFHYKANICSSVLTADTKESVGLEDDLAVFKWSWSQLEDTVLTFMCKKPKEEYMMYEILSV